MQDSNPISPEHADKDQVQTVTEAKFSRLVLEGSGPIVVGFMSYGSGFCRAIESILQQVADNLHSEQKFIRVNVPVQTGLAGTYGIDGTPTFVMFLNGNEVGRAEGPEATLAGITSIVTQPFNP